MDPTEKLLEFDSLASDALPLTPPEAEKTERLGALQKLDHEIERIGVGPFHYYCLALLGLGNASDAVEILCIGYILPVYPEEVSAFTKGTLTASVFAGMLVGGILCGLFGDRIGRKNCLLASVGINAVFGIMSAFSVNIVMLVVCRIFAGIGVGGTVPSIFTIATEILPVHKRGFYITVVAWHWMVGQLFTAGIAWILLGSLGLSWRIFALTCAIPASLCFFLCLFFLPRSPRWLAMAGDFNGCCQVLSAAASMNNVKFSPEEILNLAEIEQASDEIESRKDNRQSWVKLYSPSLIRSTLLLQLSWFALSFGSYGLMVWIPSIFENSGFKLDSYQDAFFVAAANLPGNILSSLLMDRVGRKAVLAGGMTLASLSALLFAFESNVTLVVLAACSFNMFSIGGWNALDCLSAESFPTTVRTSAMGALAASGRVGSIVAQFVNGSLEERSIATLLLTTAAVMCFGALVCLFLPKDPTNKQLEMNVK